MMKALNRWMLLVTAVVLAVVPALALVFAIDFDIASYSLGIKIAAAILFMAAYAIGGLCLVRFIRSASRDPEGVLYPLRMLQGVSLGVFVALVVAFFLTVVVCVKFDLDASFLRERRVLLVGLMYTSLGVFSIANGTLSTIRYKLPPLRIRIYKEDD
jgi:hypothetical protein